MNFNFKVKGFEVKMKGEGNVKVEEIEVGYENVKLSEIPAIIKETRKTFKEIKDMIDAEKAEAGVEVVHHPFPFPIPVPVSEHEAMFFGQCPCEQTMPADEESQEENDEKANALFE